MPCSAVQCSAVQCSAVQCNAMHSRVEICIIVYLIYYVVEEAKEVRVTVGTLRALSVL